MEDEYAGVEEEVVAPVEESKSEKTRSNRPRVKSNRKSFSASAAESKADQPAKKAMPLPRSKTGRNGVEETKADAPETPRSPAPLSPGSPGMPPSPGLPADLEAEDMLRNAQLNTDNVDLSQYNEMDFEGSTNVSEQEEEAEPEPIDEEPIGTSEEEEEAEVVYAEPTPIMYATELRGENLVEFMNSRAVNVYVDTMDAFINGAGESVDFQQRTKELAFSRCLDLIYNNVPAMAVQDLRLLDPTAKRDDPQAEEERQQFTAPVFHGALGELKKAYKFYASMAYEKELAELAAMQDRTVDDIKAEKAEQEEEVPEFDLEAEFDADMGEVEEMRPDEFQFQDERGQGNIPIKLLARLNDSFNNCAPEDYHGEQALWFEDFCQAVAMMGKRFDSRALRNHYLTCQKMQAKLDDLAIKYLTDDPEIIAMDGDEGNLGFNRNFEDESYEPQLRDVTVLDEFEEVDLTKSKHRIRRMIAEAFEHPMPEVVPEAPHEENCMISFFTSVEVDNNHAGKKASETDNSFVYVMLPTGLLATVPRFRTVRQVKAFLRVKYGIPDAHVELKDSSGGEINDHHSMESIQYMTLERPIYRCIWSQFFIDHLVQDVDEDEVLKHWRNICALTRQSRLDNEEGGAPFDPTESPHRMFCYASDLRKVMTGFGEKMADEEADIFIRECRPMTAKELMEAERDNADEFGEGLMSAEEYAKPENKYDLHSRIYHEFYYNALTDDTL